MARFVTVTDNDIHSFSEKQENENTKKIFYDIKVFLEFLHSKNEAINIYEIPSKELNNFAKNLSWACGK